MKMNASLQIGVFALCIAASLPLSAERRRAVTPSAGVLSIEFVDVSEHGTPLIAAGSDAWVELDTVSQQAGSAGNSVRVRRQIGIRILRTGGLPGGTATVTARLDSSDGRSSVRIDGQLLAGVPALVSSRAAIGAMTIHTLEVDVPDSVAAGPLAVSISWEVTTQ